MQYYVIVITAIVILVIMTWGVQTSTGSTSKLLSRLRGFAKPKMASLDGGTKKYTIIRWLVINFVAHMVLRSPSVNQLT